MTRFSTVPHRSRLTVAHAACWLGAGILAAAYIGSTALTPGALQESAARGSFHTDRLLSQLSTDVHGVQARLAAGEEQTQAILGRMASLEEKTSLLTSMPPPGLQNGPQDPARSRETSQVAPAPAAEAAPITTGAIMQKIGAPAQAAILPRPDIAPEATTIPAPPPPPKSVHAIQLATAPNLDALRLNWSLLSERHRALLGAMQTRYRQTPGKPNAPFQLIAGPVRSTAEAARICKELSASGVTCRATSFSGETL